MAGTMVRWVGLVLAVLVLAAGCIEPASKRPEGTVTAVDRARFEALRSDPFLHSVGAKGEPGSYLERGHVQKSQVHANSSTYTTIRKLRAASARIMQKAEKAGWILYSAGCTDLRQPRPLPDDPIELPFSWSAHFYKYVPVRRPDGSHEPVSLAMQIDVEDKSTEGSLEDKSSPRMLRGDLYFQGYAPQVDEPADLLPERPPRVERPCMLEKVIKNANQGLNVGIVSYGEEGDLDMDDPTR